MMRSDYYMNHNQNKKRKKTTTSCNENFKIRFDIKSEALFVRNGLKDIRLKSELIGCHSYLTFETQYVHTTCLDESRKQSNEKEGFLKQKNS